MSPNLRNAIKLREWVRRALDTYAGVDATLIELNRRADAAYRRLNAEEARVYREWAFRDWSDDEFLLFGG